MKRLRKFARSMSEVLIAVVVLGVIIALLIALNNVGGAKYSAATAKKTQFESTLGDIQKAMIGDPAMTPNVACDAAALRNYYIENLAGATAVDYQIDGIDVAALRVPGYGILAILPSEDNDYCKREWQSDTFEPTQPPVALVAIQDGANPEASDLPISVVEDFNGDGFGDLASGDMTQMNYGAGTNSSTTGGNSTVVTTSTTSNNDIVPDTFVLGTSLLMSAELDGMIAGSSQGSSGSGSGTGTGTSNPVSLPAPECSAYEPHFYSHPNFQLVNNIDADEYIAYNSCAPASAFREYNGVDAYCCDNEQKLMYVGHISTVRTGCKISFCSGNGFASEADARIFSANNCDENPTSAACKNVKIINSGMVNDSCRYGTHDALVRFSCPSDRPYWVSNAFYRQKHYYDYDAEDTIDSGSCVLDCTKALNEDKKVIGLIAIDDSNCGCDSSKGFIIDDDSEGRHGTYTCVCPDGQVYSESADRCVNSPCSPASVTIGSVTINRVYDEANTETTDKCICPSFDSLSSVSQTEIRNFLFENNAVYSESSRKCYSSCNIGGSTNKYPNSSFTECKTCDLSTSKIVTDTATLSYSCVCDASKGYVSDGNGGCKCDSSKGLALGSDNKCHCDASKNLKDETTSSFGNATSCECFDGFEATKFYNTSSTTTNGESGIAECDCTTENHASVRNSRVSSPGASYADDDYLCQCKTKAQLTDVLYENNAKYDDSKEACMELCDPNGNNHKVPDSNYEACVCDEASHYVDNGNGGCSLCDPNKGLTIIGGVCHCNPAKNLKDKSGSGVIPTCEPYAGYTPDKTVGTGTSTSVVEASCKTANNKVEEIKNTGTAINTLFTDNDKICRCPNSTDKDALKTAYDSLRTRLADGKTHKYKDTGYDYTLTCMEECPVGTSTTTDGLDCAANSCPAYGTAEYNEIISNLKSNEIFVNDITKDCKDTCSATDHKVPNKTPVGDYPQYTKCVCDEASHYVDNGNGGCSLCDPNKGLTIIGGACHCNPAKNLKDKSGSGVIPTCEPYEGYTPDKTVGTGTSTSVIEASCKTANNKVEEVKNSTETAINKSFTDNDKICRCPKDSDAGAMLTAYNNLRTQLADGKTHKYKDTGTDYTLSCKEECGLGTSTTTDGLDCAANSCPAYGTTEYNAIINSIKDTNYIFNANRYSDGCKEECSATAHKVPNKTPVGDYPQYTKCVCDEANNYVDNGNGGCVLCDEAKGMKVIGGACHCDSTKNLKDSEDSEGAIPTCEPYDGFTPETSGGSSTVVINASCNTDKNKTIQEINTDKTSVKINDRFDDNDRVCRCLQPGDEKYEDFIHDLVADGTNKYFDTGYDIDAECNVPCPVNQAVSSNGLECHCDSNKYLKDVGFSSEDGNATECECYSGFAESEDSQTHELTCTCDYPKEIVGNVCQCKSEADLYKDGKNYLDGYTYDAGSATCREECPADNDGNKVHSLYNEQSGHYECSNCPLEANMIKTVDDLNNVRKNLAGSYCLMNDIPDVGEFTPIGTPTVPFTGKFFGLDFVISDVTIDPDLNNGGAGLFGGNTGIIQDLGLENITSNGKGNQPVAGLVANNAGTISNVYVKNPKLNPAKAAVGVGCLAGQQSGGIIKESYCSGMTLDATPLNITNVGALVGIQANGASLQDCYVSDSTIKISNTTNVGGIVGNQSGNIINVYSTCVINGSNRSSSADNSSLGGIAGSFAEGTTRESYWQFDAGNSSNGDMNSLLADYGCISEDCISEGLRLAGILLNSNPKHPSYQECKTDNTGAEIANSCKTISTYEDWQWETPNDVWCFSCNPERLPVLVNVPNFDNQCTSGECTCLIDNGCKYCPKQYEEDSACKVVDNQGKETGRIGRWSREACECVPCDGNKNYNPVTKECGCSNANTACEAKGEPNGGYIDPDTCECTACPGEKLFDVVDDEPGCYCPPAEDLGITGDKLKYQWVDENLSSCVNECPESNIEGQYTQLASVNPPLCRCPRGDNGLAAYGYNTTDNCGCPANTTRTKVAYLIAKEDVTIDGDNATVDLDDQISGTTNAFVCACTPAEACPVGAAHCHSDLTSSVSAGEWVGVDMGDGNCQWMYDPLVVDYDKDTEIETKVGCGVDLTGKGGIKLCAFNGDKMLAIKKLNSDGKIDRTMIFGTDTINPFNKGKKINAINGFEALNEIAMSAMAYADDNDIDVQVFGIEGFNDLRAIKYLLNQIGWDIGFISDDNVTTLEPLGHVIAISKQYQEKAETGAQMEQKQVGSYMDTAKKLFKAADVWVRETFKGLFK